MAVPKLKLRDGNEVPMLAFGTGTAWFKEPEDHDKFNQNLVAIVKQALGAGFCHLDCADMYDNEAEVGVAISESGIPRNDLFITTKVGDGISDIPAAIDRSLKKLQVEYVDLYLTHVPWNLHKDEDYHRAWEAMEQVKKTGKARSIGVSNFVRSDMEALLSGSTSDPPVVNQLEYHPYIQRENGGELYIPWMQSQGIQVEAFKGLSPVVRCPEGPLVEPLKRIANAHDTTEAVVMFRWFQHQGIASVTTTSRTERLKGYFSSAVVHLAAEEVDEISRIG